MTLVHDGIKTETKNAVLFQFAEDSKWIPMKLIMEYTDQIVEVLDWFAEKEGLEIYECQ